MAKVKRKYKYSADKNNNNDDWHVLFENENKLPDNIIQQQKQMVVDTFVRTVKPAIKYPTDNHKNCGDKNDSSVTFEIVIQEEETIPLRLDHIIMFPNAELWDEHAQK